MAASGYTFDKSRVVVRIDVATPLMARLSADDSDAPGKNSDALQGANCQPSELPAMACEGHVGRRLLSGHGTVWPREG